LKGWRVGLSLLLAAVLLFLFFRGVDWNAMGRALRAADPLYLCGVVLVTLATYAARAWRWGFLLAPLARVPFGRLFSATVIGFMSGLLIPRAGEVVRPYLVARNYPVSTSAGFASIVLERLVDLITVLLLFALYLYVLPMPAAQTRGPLLGVLKVAGAAAGAGALVILVVLLAWHRYAEPAMRLVDRLLRPFPDRFAGAVSRAARSFGEGLAVLKASPSHLAAILAQSMVVWLLLALGIYWNNRAFGLHLPFHTAFLILAFLTVGVAIPTPGTVGGFHAFYRAALTEAYGVDNDVAAAAGIASHALGNLPVLLLGLAFLGREGLTVGKVANMSEAR
jgi:glycosyltransferase 2 family protein